MWLWPATDHEPHCRHVPINTTWRWTESTPRSGWWRSHVAGIYSDCSTREITTDRSRKFSCCKSACDRKASGTWETVKCDLVGLHLRLHAVIIYRAGFKRGAGGTKPFILYFVANDRCLRGIYEAFILESYTVFICQQSYLLLFGIPSPTHSFFPGLKPSFSTNLSHCSPSFLST